MTTRLQTVWDEKTGKYVKRPFRWWNCDWFGGTYHISMGGISINEAGAGPYFVWRWGRIKDFRLVLWTPWIRLALERDYPDEPLSFTVEHPWDEEEGLRIAERMNAKRRRREALLAR